MEIDPQDVLENLEKHWAMCEVCQRIQAERPLSDTSRVVDKYHSSCEDTQVVMIMSGLIKLGVTT